MWTERLPYGAGFIFFLALVVTTFFVGANIDRGSNMTNPTRAIAKDGMPAAIIQKIQETTLQRGAPAPILQPIAQPQQSGSPSAQAPAPAPAPAPEKK
jgi:hypothetical protein